MITPCSPWVGSTAVTKPRPSCWAITEPATSSAEIVSRAVMPEHGADHDLLDQHHDRRPERAGIDVIGVAMQRQQHGGENQRDGQPQPRRNVLLAEPGQQHHHGAGAREHQEKSRPERRQEGQVDAHGLRPLSRW